MLMRPHSQTNVLTISDQIHGAFLTFKADTLSLLSPYNIFRFLCLYIILLWRKPHFCTIHDFVIYVVIQLHFVQIISGNDFICLFFVYCMFKATLQNTLQIKLLSSAGHKQYDIILSIVVNDEDAGKHKASLYICCFAAAWDFAVIGKRWHGWSIQS